LSRARWLERESTYLLPVEYHHVVFTLPAELAELALTNALVGQLHQPMVADGHAVRVTRQVL